MAKRTTIFAALFAAALSFALSVQAENYDYYWKGGSGNYFTQSMWQLSDGTDAPVPLSSASDVISTFVQADGSTVSFDYSHLGDGVKSLTIGGDNGTVSVTRSSGNTLTVAPNKFISVLDKGTLTVQNTTIIDAGGTLTVDGGTYNQTGMTISGTFDYTSGANFVNNNTITLNDGGSFNLAGSGQFRMNSASAIMNIQGGTATIDNISYIGVTANGVINQSGGSATFNKSLVFGWGAGNGTYNLSGGTLTTTADAGLWCSKDSGFNAFNMTGGTANFNQTGNSFEVGLYQTFPPKQVANVFNLYSGTVNAADTFAIQYGGTLFVAKNGETGGNGVLNAKAITLTNTGNLNMSSGTINVGEGGIASSDGAYSITLSGGTFGTNGSNWSSALNAEISSGAVTFAPAEGKMITWSGALTGDGGIIKTGAGDLKITAGDSGQAYTGGTTVSAGTLYLTGNNRGYSSVGTGDVTINSGAAVVAQSHNVFGSGDGSVMPNVIINGGSLTPNQYLHMKSLEINSGTVNSHGTSGDGLDFSTRNGTITSTGASSIASAIKNSSTLTIDVDDSVLTLSGVLTGSGSISKNGDGTLKLSGTNTFSGGITVNAGKLLITGSSVGTGTTMNKNALIEFAIASGTVSIANNVDNLTNGGKTIKTGAGTLSTNKWISGQVEVQEGTLKLTNGFGSGKRFNGTITIAQGATLDCAYKDALGYGSANTIMNIYGTMNSSVDNETLNNTELHMYGGTAQATSGSTFDILNAGVKFYSYALPNAETTTVSTISPTLLLRHNGTLPIDTAANSRLELTGEITGWYNNSTQYNCSITKTGDGTLEISANNPKYSGTTTISAGTLKLSGAGTLGTGSVTNNATLEFAHTGAQSFANVISGTGAVNKTGDGTLELTGANAYTGTTTISAGTLKLSGAGAPGTGNVENNATLEFAQTGAQSFSNVISGTGAVIKSGAGTVTLSGANTYTGKTTISAGTLEVSNNFTSSSSLAGSGTLKLSGNQKYFDIGDASEFTGTVQVFDTGISAQSRVYLAGANGTTSTNIDLSNATVVINGNTSGKFSELTFFKGGSTLTVGTLNGNNYGRIINLDSSSDAAYNNLTVSSGTFAGQIGREDASGSSYAYVNKINLIKAGDGTFTFSGIPYYFGETNIQGGVLKFVNDNTSGNKLFNRSNALKGSGTLQVVGNTDNWVLFAINANASSPQEFSGLLDVSGNFVFYQNTNLGNATLHVAEDSYATMHGGNTKNLTVKELNTESGSKVRISHASPGAGNFATLTVGSGTVNGDLGEIANNAYYNWVKLNKVSDGSEDGGRLTLAGAFLYTGETTVSGGVLELTGDAVSANGPVTVGDNGTLIYNLAEGQSKLLTIDNSNKIVSTGEVEKTGDGTLQLYAAAENMIDAQHFLVSSGRLDMKEYFEGTLEVGKKLDEGYTTATFSPGNSVGSLTIDGVFTLNPGSTLLMEIGGSDPEDNDILIVNGDITLGNNAIITLAKADEYNLGVGETFTMILTANNISDYNILDFIQTSDFTDLNYEQISYEGSTVYAITARTLNANEIPEPSTWALLILGAAGLLYWRKKK